MILRDDIIMRLISVICLHEKFTWISKVRLNYNSSELFIPREENYILSLLLNDINNGP